MINPTQFFDTCFSYFNFELLKHRKGRRDKEEKERKNVNKERSKEIKLTSVY